MAHLKFKCPSITFARVPFRRYRKADALKSRGRQSCDTNTSGLPKKKVINPELKRARDPSSIIRDSVYRYLESGDSSFKLGARTSPLGFGGHRVRARARNYIIITNDRSAGGSLSRAQKEEKKERRTPTRHR
jgi:hypothetical protein